MTRIILHFPVRNDARLRCVWVETGNPVQPLACKWVSGQIDEEGSADRSEGPRFYQLCA